MTKWARTTVMLAAVLLAASLSRVAPAGFALSTSKSGMSLELKAAFVTVAFDFGQACSKADSCGRLV